MEGWILSEKINRGSERREDGGESVRKGQDGGDGQTDSLAGMEGDMCTD